MILGIVGRNIFALAQEFFGAENLTGGQTLNAEAATGAIKCEGHKIAKYGSAEWWFDLTVAVFCCCFSGLMSGLTVGLTSLNYLDLEIQARIDPSYKKSVETIFNVIEKHHWMLVTLLLLNAIAMETLPIYLDKMMTSYQAILVSVTGILFFGEIIPQAICTGPNQIKIAECMCPIVYFFMRVTSPISWPIAKLLDLMMGEHEVTRFNNIELKHLISLHTKDALKDVSFNSDTSQIIGLDNHQAEMIAGALTLESLKIGDNQKQILTPVNEMKFLQLDTVLDQQSIFWIKDVGYSRFPIIIS